MAVKCVVEVSGVAPMLVHNIESMSNKKPENISHADWENDDRCFEAKLYKDGDMLVVPPRVWLGLIKCACQRAAANGVKPKKGRSYTQLAKALVFMDKGMTIAEQRKHLAKEIQYVTIDKKKILRVWPKFDKWSGIVEFMIADESQLSPDALRAILDYGAKFVGLGDYRPQFGRFLIKQFDVVPLDL